MGFLGSKGVKLIRQQFPPLFFSPFCQIKYIIDIEGQQMTNILPSLTVCNAAGVGIKCNTICHSLQFKFPAKLFVSCKRLTTITFQWFCSLINPTTFNEKPT